MRLQNRSEKLNRDALAYLLFYLPLLGIILVFYSWMKPGCIQISERFARFIAVLHSKGEDEPWLSLKEFREESGCGTHEAQCHGGREILGDGKHCALERSHQNLL